MIDLLDPYLSLLDFVPESISSDAEIVALSLALDPEIRDVAASIIEAIILPRIEDLEDDILDELAWGFRLNRLQVWDVATTAQKRIILKQILAIRKRSGTPYAIKTMLALIPVPFELVEWFTEGAAPYTWRLRLFVNNIGVTLSLLVQISELVLRFTSTSRYVSELATEADSAGPIYPYVALTVGRQTTIPFGGP